MTSHGGCNPETTARSWLRCYRCWSQDLEVQVHYEGIHKIDPETGERAEVVDELQEAVVQCLDCMHDQPHLGFNNGRVEPIEDRWERMIAGTPWVASCTVAVDADDVESCSGPEAGDALSYAAFGDHGVREFFTHVRFHKHEDDSRIIVHLLVELYARSLEEATEVLESAARGALTITSLAEESRPPAAAGGEAHGSRIGAVRLAEALLERLQLGVQLVRELVELRVVLVELRQLRAPLLDVHAQQLGHVAFGRRRGRRASMPSLPTGGISPIGVSAAAPWPAQRANTHASTREFSPKPGHRKRPVARPCGTS